MSEIREFLEAHLQAVFDGNLDHYHATTAADLSIYEWYIVPARIDGVPFHDFMITEGSKGTAQPMTGQTLAGADKPGEKPRIRFDLAHYREQVYGDTAIVSYTLLITQGTQAGVTVRSYNESRVIVRFPDGWRVVHVHKSPAFKSGLEPD